MTFGINTIAQSMRSPFLRGLASYSVGEIATKMSRLIAIIAMARVLTPGQVGIVAAAIAVAEILKALTENGVGQKIIAASKGEVEAVCKTAARLNLVWISGLFVVQNIVAYAIYAYTGQTEAAMVVALMSVEYLFMPAGLVQSSLAMREGRLSGTAAVAGAQNVSANIFLAILVLIWPSPLAVAVSRIATAPIWLVGMRRLRPWTPTPTGPRAPLNGFVRFGSPILGVEVLKVLRLQADKLIIGSLMGTEVLGIYFFTINAGLGIANSFGIAFSTVLYPHLCAADNRAKTLRRALGFTLALLTPVIVLQALAAPYYVPMVFGEQWAEMADYVAILCFAALPGIVWAAAAQDLRARARTDLELAYSAFIALAVTGGIFIAAPYGLSVVIYTVLATTTISQLASASFAMGNTLTMRSA